MVLLIIKIGSVMNLGYKKIILLYNEAIYETADVISSFIYIYDGFLVVSINKNRFRDVAVAVYPDSAYLVFDGRGKMIFSTPEGFDEKTVSDAVKSSKNGELKLSGKRYFINELYSTVNSLEYISIAAGDTAFRRLLKSRRTMAAAYMKSFKLTPCTTVEAHKENSSTLWFNSRFHRSNLYIHDKKIFLRDIFVFNENYRERYFDEVTENKNLYFDNLPVIDCFRWSNKEKIGGGFFEKNSKQAAVIKDFSVQKNSGSSVCVMLELDEGIMKITYNERSIIFDFPSEGYILSAGIYKGENPVKGFTDGRMLCEYCGFCYSLVLSGAVCKINENGYSIVPGGKSFEIRF